MSDLRCTACGAEPAREVALYRCHECNQLSDAGHRSPCCGAYAYAAGGGCASCLTPSYALVRR